MTDNWRDKIVINPKVLVGKPVIKGTRLSVDFIIELLAQGWTFENIVKNYPQLKKEDIQAALEYSSHSLNLETIYSIEA
ncbi:MAG: DUF433 domain-containing protein [Nanoarchaeota archaeon]